MNKHNLMQLHQALKTLEGVMYLLEISNHSSYPASTYAHHVRDRLSESIVKELTIAHEKINETHKSIRSEMSPEELADYKREIPF
jgi:hypothetical protein